MKENNIWFYIKNYKFNSIFIKYFLIILLFLEIPLSLMAVISINSYNKSVRNEIEILNANNTSRIRELMDTVYLETEKLSFRLSVNQDVEQFIISDNIKYEQYDDIKQSRNILQEISLTSFISDYIHSVYVYSSVNRYIFSSVHGGMEFERFQDNEWIEICKQYGNNSRFFVFRTIPEKEGENVISSIRKAPLNMNWKNGYVVINISTDSILEHLNSAFEGYVDSIMIVDNDEVLFNSSDNGISSGEWLDIIQQVKIQRKKEFDTGNGREILYTADSKVSNWQYVLTYSLKRFEEQERKILTYFVMLMLICILGALMVSFVVATRIFSPIREILGTIRHQGLKGKAGINEKHVSEMALILSNISTSNYQIEHLQNKLTERMEMLKHAKTSALQAQINPHFLCNVLETINWISIDIAGGENKASDMLIMLSDLLRTSLNTENSFITVREEIQYVQNYLDIQNVCYNNRYTVLWDLQEEILEYKIIKLVLQPIVENAIEHGILPSKRKGEIKILGKTEGNIIILSVKDNGIGMEEQKIIAINEEMNRDYARMPHSIGLRNVNQRIKLVYGEEYGLKVLVTEQGGTQVNIAIPKSK